MVTRPRSPVDPHVLELKREDRMKFVTTSSRDGSRDLQRSDILVPDGG